MATTTSQAQANFEFTLLNAEAEATTNSDLYLWLRESGLPAEVSIRLMNMVDCTGKVADKIISIGKIILIKVIEFVKAHPNLSIGIAVGAALSLLASTIPFLGAFLAPIVGLLGIAVGAVAGHRLDKLEKGQVVNTNVETIEIGKDVIEIAKEFFKLLIDIFNVVFTGPVLQGA
jgi:xanthosine utilization system XapX-like protein